MRKLRGPRVNKVFVDVFSERDINYIQSYALEHHESLKKIKPEHESGYGAFQIKDTPELRMLHEKLLPVTRKMFNNQSLIPNSQVLSIHTGPQPLATPTNFEQDGDYVVQVVVYQHFAWKTTVGDEFLELVENQGLFFKADQNFAPSEFPDPFNNVVANAFFFFIQP